MATKKKIEVFSAGCSTCKETIELVRRLAGSHDVEVHDMQKAEVAARAKQFGVKSAPAVVIDGKWPAVRRLRTRRARAAFRVVVRPRSPHSLRPAYA